MKIVLLGATLRSGNRGVNALTRGTIELLSQLYNINIIKIQRISRDPDYTDSLVITKKDIIVEETCCSAYKLIFLTFICILRRVSGTLLDSILRENKFLNNIYEADLILDISEGDSFSDIYGKKRFIIHSFNKLIVLLLKKKLILLPQTIGPFSNPLVKQIAKCILKKCNKILTRDELSYNLCCADTEFRIDGNKVLLVPDMAFFMKSANHINIKSITSCLDRKKNILIGINVSGLLYNGGYTRNNMFNLKVDYKLLINKIIHELISESKNLIILIPHVITYGDELIEDDLTVCKQLYEELAECYPKQITYINEPYREHELKQIIGSCDFFIGARMHACIGAISMCVPTIPIAYSRKFLGVWKMFGLESYVADPKIQTEDQILLTIKNALASKEMINLNLQKEMKQVKEKIADLISKSVDEIIIKK